MMQQPVRYQCPAQCVKLFSVQIVEEVSKSGGAT